MERCGLNCNLLSAHVTDCSAGRLHKCSTLFDAFTVYQVTGGTTAASTPATGIGDPAVCGSQPLVTPVSLCRFRD